MLIFNSWMYHEAGSMTPTDSFGMPPLHHHIAKYLMVPKENMVAPGGFDSVTNMMSLLPVLLDIMQQLVELMNHLSDLGRQIFGSNTSLLEMVLVAGLFPLIVAEDKFNRMLEQDDDLVEGATTRPASLVLGSIDSFFENMSSEDLYSMG